MPADGRADRVGQAPALAHLLEEARGHAPAERGVHDVERVPIRVAAADAGDFGVHVAPGEPGHETWPKTADSIPDAWKIGGASTWQTGSYDPELDLVYWGVGNAGPYDAKYRGNGDALYTNCVVAIRPKTGEIVWHYQWTPAETYDFDGNNENVLGELTLNGKKRKVLMHADRNGLLYVLDRATGEVLAGNPYVKTNWSTGVDLKTGRVVETDVARRLRAGETVYTAWCMLPAPHVAETIARALAAMPANAPIPYAPPILAQRDAALK